jgi:anthranilate synthase/aminodeoxychorismate synthase-like glutamine amidotransferase
MILLIDNYDSFTFNLFQLMAQLGAEVDVIRNDAVTLDGIEQLSPAAIVLSPGPGTPDKAGICLDIVHRFAGTVPLLGICLGHQCIGQAFGGTVISAPELMHGKTSMIYHQDLGIFEGLANPLSAIRYHSLSLDPESLPDCLTLTARTDNGVVMGLRHVDHDVEGVQFHPESVMTPQGPQLMANWLRRIALRAA